MSHHLAAISMAALLAACGGVSHTLHRDVPPPRTIAILPFPGTASPAVRAAARQLIQSRLRTLGYRLADIEHVDRVLAERGWLRDPGSFVTPDSRTEVCAALGTDAVLLGTDIEESGFNYLVLRRHRIGGTLAIELACGREWWHAEHAAGKFGGFLLTSGQVFAEFRAQGEHGTPMATMALLDEFTADAIGTVPAMPVTDSVPMPPPIANVVARRTTTATGTRLLVEAAAPSGCELRFAIEGASGAVPMVELPRTGHYRGWHDLPSADHVALTVHATDPWGQASTARVDG
ncbi:MAG: hypothetical protein MUC36_11070 [Planctomycetes bacterium]|jgi:hypothetical protein|nr:hypothetical protein [Planctomycetota bacterium]